MTLKSMDDYGPQFQIKVLASLLTNKKFLINVQDVISEDYFPNKSHQWILNRILEYYKRFHTTPTMEVMSIELQKVDNDVLKISIREQLKQAYGDSVTDLEYVQDEFQNFCRNRALRNALLLSIDLLKGEEYDTIREVINDAIKAGQEKTLGHDYHKDIETRYRDDARSVIPFPWPQFNKLTQGGFGGGDLVLIFGNPKGGKSWVICAMAVHAARLGYNTTIYALELSAEYFAKRIDSCLTGIDVSEIHKYRDRVEKEVAILPGKIIIKDYPPKRASLNTIESHQQQLKSQENFISDLIFVDYLDYLRPRSKRNERKEEIDDVYVDAKGLAKEMNIPIISPSQGNRTGAGKKILEGTNIAGSYDKLMIADIVISLSRNREDKLEGTGRFHFMGNRYGPDGITFESTIDTKTGHIVVGEEVEIEDEGEGKQTVVAYGGNRENLQKKLQHL